MAKTAAKKAPTKTEVLNNIAETSGVGKKEVQAVLDALTEEIRKNLGNRGPGVFAIPGLVKIEKKKVPAQKAIPNWTNPFTKEVTTKPAKPATTKIKVRALKNLKEM